MGLGILIAAGLAMLAFSGGAKKKPGVPASLPAPKAAAFKTSIGPARIIPSKAPNRPVKVVIPAHPAEPRAIAKRVLKRAAVERGVQTRVTPVTTMPSEAQAGVMMARKQAQGVADMVRTRGAKYDRMRLAAWQRNAGLKDDGLYGPATAARLRQLGAQNVTGQIFKAKAKGK